ncbi:four helix bundle protein [candidate division KSB1 bacterium]|nr:four helix bundle protein [candidate division KSB1 bacterium]MBL7094146.1 four helix bundle protein [candidate division KSB1 bacterium]
MFKSFKDMPIWKVAMEIAEKIFKYTNNLPRKEDYGFTSQIRRSGLSISANIAEAFGRYHISNKINFYYTSRGSLTETQSHLEYGKRVGYINQNDAESLDKQLELLHKDINKVITALRKSK